MHQKIEAIKNHANNEPSCDASPGRKLTAFSSSRSSDDVKCSPATHMHVKHLVERLLIKWYGYSCINLTCYVITTFYFATTFMFSILIISFSY